MTQQISITDETFARLQMLAKPFVDTPETVIQRLLDSYTGYTATVGAEGYKSFDPVSPPSLMHTTVQMAIVNGVTLKPNETYWNSILAAMIRHIAKSGMKPKDISETVFCNTMVGEHSVNGYKYIPEAGISVQGLDANNAWKTIYALAWSSGQDVEVRFRWQDKDGLSNAGVAGILSYKHPVPTKVAT